ncbi:MAG TPA: RNA methyltransferase [Anaerolineaceae bacterium]|nr:RNA methyltransferase [Anaerolineaceae bacterium]
MITSLSNPTIVSIRKLLKPKDRRTTGLFLAEGLRVVGQALDSGAEIRQLIICPDLLVSEYGQQLVHRARKLGIDCLEVNEPVFSSLARKDTPKGIAAVIAQRWQTLESLAPQEGELWVGLQAIQNPGNLGTILRTCDAVGATHVLLLDDCTDPYDPAAVKASMGSIFTVRLTKTHAEAFRAWHAQHAEMKIVGTSDHADEDYAQTVYPQTCLLLMGSERQGLSDEYIQLCAKMVRIPMEGTCDSLNLAVATGIILYQIYNQRRNIFKRAGQQ